MITFDFDDTLTRPVWDKKQQLFESSENPNYDTFALLKSFDEQGEEIMIVTTRWSRIEIVDFVERDKFFEQRSVGYAERNRAFMSVKLIVLYYHGMFTIDKNLKYHLVSFIFILQKLILNVTTS